MLPDRTRIVVENVPAREKWREVAGIGRYCNLRVVGIVKQLHGDLVGTVCHCGGERLLGATEPVLRRDPPEVVPDHDEYRI